MRIKYCFFIKNSVNLISTTYGKGGVILEKEKGNFLQGCLGCVGLIIILGIVIGGCSIFFGGDDDKKEEKKVDYSTLNEENVKTALEKSEWASRQKVKKIDIEDDVVVLELETTMDTTEDFQAIRMFVVGDLEQLQGFKKIRVLNIEFSTIFKDKYGETEQGLAFKGKIMGKELRKIKFDNFYESDLEKVMDFVYVHPAIR